MFVLPEKIGSHRTLKRLAGLLLGGFLRFHACFQACMNRLDRIRTSVTEPFYARHRLRGRLVVARRPRRARQPYRIAVLLTALEAAMTTNSISTSPIRPPAVAVFFAPGVDWGFPKNGRREHRDVDEADGQCCCCCVLLHWCLLHDGAVVALAGRSI
jgi:hypothetical protein